MHVSTCFYYPYSGMSVKRMGWKSKVDLDCNVTSLCAPSHFRFREWEGARSEMIWKDFQVERVNSGCVLACRRHYPILYLTWRGVGDLFSMICGRSLKYQLGKGKIYQFSFRITPFSG